MQYRPTLALMCAKSRVNILGSFKDIWQNAEWPRFLAHPVYTLGGVWYVYLILYKCKKRNSLKSNVRTTW